MAASPARRAEQRREHTNGAPQLRKRGQVVVVDGFGVSLTVERGRLVIHDGAARQRRERVYSRVRPGLARVLILGSAGSLSLAAVRWLADLGIPLVQVDRNGRLLLVSAPAAVDDARLRRAQAYALGNNSGLAVARYLLGEKLAGQEQLLDRLPGGSGARTAFESAWRAFNAACSINELVIAERDAALAYWQAWARVEVRFPTRELGRIPDRWRLFGQRSSPLTTGPRSAVSPANALLNYLYALLEGETRIACQAVGLDPGIGIVHADVRSRASLALDLMEAVRPQVDQYLLDLLEQRTFKAADFYETGRGVCRLLAPLTHQLANTPTHWARLIAPICERVASMLASAPGFRIDRLPTPLTNENRHAGRRRHRPRGIQPATKPALPARCLRCGGDVPHRKRLYCDACLPHVHAQQHSHFQQSGLTALAQRRADGLDPTHGGDAARTRGRAISSRKREIAEWEATYGQLIDLSAFQREILPRIQQIPLRRLMEATGLSLRYCSQIRRGEKVPHPRHWQALREAGRMA